MPVHAPNASNGEFTNGDEHFIPNLMQLNVTCSAAMTASATSIVIPSLAGYGDNYFDKYYMHVLKNGTSATAAPADEWKKITAYSSDSGTFTVEAFSTTLSASSEVEIVSKMIYEIYMSETDVLADFILVDKDDFDVADADANTARWASGYVTGTEGGSADIDTTTDDALTITVNPDSSPTEARYATIRKLPLYGDVMKVWSGMSLTWGTMGTNGCSAGMLISKGNNTTPGTAYDSTNYLALERKKTSAANQYIVSGKLNNVAITSTTLATTDDIVGLKIERWDNVWKFFYSTILGPAYDWKLLAQVEDPSGYMTNQVTLFYEAYSKGSADAESVVAAFTDFRYSVGSGGGDQYLVGDYNSAWVARDEDGNAFERLEDLRQDLVGTAGILTAPTAQYSTTAANVAGMITGIVFGMTESKKYDDWNDINSTTCASLDGQILSIDQGLWGTDGVRTMPNPTTCGNGASLAAMQRSAINALTGSDSYNTWTNMGSTAIVSADDAFQQIAVAIGNDVNNKYNPTIQGSARTSMDAADGAMATYFKASGATYAGQVNSTTCADVETSFEEVDRGLWGAGIRTAPTAQYSTTAASMAGMITGIVTGMTGSKKYDAWTNMGSTTIVSADGAFQQIAIAIGNNVNNKYNPTIQGSARTSMDAADGAMATYFEASGATYAAQVNSTTCADVETSFEELNDGMWGTGIRTAPSAQYSTTAASIAGMITGIVYGLTESKKYNDWARIGSTTIISLDGAIYQVAKPLGIQGERKYSTAIGGSTQATIDASLQAIADEIGAGTFLATINSTTCTNAEACFTELDRELVGAGVRVWPTAASISASTTVSIAAAFRGLVNGIVGSDTYTNWSRIGSTTIVSLNAGIYQLAKPLGIQGEVKYKTSIDGTDQATIDDSFDALYGIFGSGAYAAQINSTTCADIETSFEEIDRGLWGAGIRTAPSAQYSTTAASMAGMVTGLVFGMTGSKKYDAWDTTNGTTCVSATKQITEIANMLSGTAGIRTWAAGVAPGDGVSLAEGLRYTSETAESGYTDIYTNNVQFLYEADVVSPVAGSMADILDKMYTAADGTGNYPASLVNDSLFCMLMCSGTTTSAPTAYNRTTMSLQANRANIGTAGAGLTAVPWNAAWDDEVESEVDDALGTIKLNKFIAVSDGTANYPASVLNDSILAKLMFKGTTTLSYQSYTTGTHSIQAIGDAVVVVDGYFDVPTADSGANATIRDVLGNKSDTEAGDSAMAKLYTINRHLHAPQWVYPSRAVPITLTANGTTTWTPRAGASQYVTIIPKNVKTSPFDIHHADISNISGNCSLEVELFYGTTTSATMNLMGVTSCTRTAAQTTSFDGPFMDTLVPANMTVRARFTASVASVTAGVKLKGHDY